jgi:hypothetical protein
MRIENVKKNENKKKNMQKFPFFFVFRSKIGGKMKMDLKKLALEKNWYLFFEIIFCQNILSGRYVSFLAQLGAPKALNPSKKKPRKNFPPEVSARAKFWDFPLGLSMDSPYVAVYRLLQPLAFSGFTKNNFEKWREKKLKKKNSF